MILDLRSGSLSKIWKKQEPEEGKRFGTFGE
jgi:hypothetical protein